MATISQQIQFRNRYDKEEKSATKGSKHRTQVIFNGIFHGNYIIYIREEANKHCVFRLCCVATGIKDIKNKLIIRVVGVDMTYSLLSSNNFDIRTFPRFRSR